MDTELHFEYWSSDAFEILLPTKKKKTHDGFRIWIARIHSGQCIRKERTFGH